MITTDGKLHIKRFMAKQVSDIGKSIAVGLGPKSEQVGDTALQFEIARSEINLISYDFVNNRIVFKASIPQELAGKIYEVGLWSSSSNSAAGEYTSRLLTSFDSNSEVWSTGSFQIANARIGIDSLRLTPATSATVVTSITDVFMDVSGNSGVDKFSIAYYNSNANVANFKVRFKTDSGNYYTLTVTSPSTGYQISTVNKSAAVATGTPSWGMITQIDVEVVAGAGGSASIDFDGIRIEDIDTINPDYVMVARELLVSPLTKVEGRVMDIEFSLPVSIP